MTNKKSNPKKQVAILKQNLAKMERENLVINTARTQVQASKGLIRSIDCEIEALQKRKGIAEKIIKGNQATADKVLHNTTKIQADVTALEAKL